MSYSDAQHMAMASQLNRKTSKFFSGLIARVEKIAMDEAEFRAERMKNILRSRFPLGGGDGRYPRHGYLNHSDIPSKQSYKNWKVTPARDRQSNPIFRLSNDSSAGGGGVWNNYNYVRNLVTGTGWSDKVKDGYHRNLVSKNGKLFSKQMPNGLENWIKRQRRLTESAIRTAIKKGGTV